MFPFEITKEELDKEQEESRLDEFYCNVLVGNEDHNGDLDPYHSICYRFSNWEEAAQFIKMSLDNGLVVEVRVPSEVKEQQCV